MLLHGQFDVIVTLSDLLLLTPLTPFLITASHERKFKIQRRIEVVVKVVLLALILHLISRNISRLACSYSKRLALAKIGMHIVTYQSTSSIH